MKIYIWTDGTEYDESPGSMGNTSPISEKWWTAHGGTITEMPDPPEPLPVYTYSKYKLMLACKERELWESVKADIEAKGKWEAFLLIQSISSDNDELQAVLPALCSKYGSEVVAAVLAEAQE